MKDLNGEHIDPEAILELLDHNMINEAKAKLEYAEPIHWVEITEKVLKSNASSLIVILKGLARNMPKN
ncbi:hypothetical protein CL633_04315 [bacterium]|nr:hypothetical protein [bacterium]|tara:strand:- start:1962 stop:2165 length:204 start_codon:yes stop_codon:yes gene_type:complete